MKKKKTIMIAIIVLIFLSLGGVISVKAYNSYNIKQNLDLGNKYLSNGQYEQAIIAFEKVIYIEPSNVEARLGLSKAYVATKRFKLAEKVLSDGIKLRVKKPDPRLFSALADVYLKEDKVQDAIKTLDQGYAATHDNGIKAKLNDISSTITVQADSIDVQVGKSLSIKLYSRDKDGKVVELTGTWLCKNSSLGNLTSSTGSNVQFNANVEGSEVIIVKIGSITKTITINVKQHILSSIDIIADKENPIVGETINLKAIGKDQSGNEMDINPTWSANNDTGNLANPQGGTNTLKCNKNGTVEVNVFQDNVKGNKSITVSKKKFSVATKVSGNGSIKSSSNASKYEDGTKVTYTAVPASGWVFKGWQGSVSGSSNPITVNVNASKTITAVFVQAPQPQVKTQPVAAVPVQPATIKPTPAPAPKPTLAPVQAPSPAPAPTPTYALTTSSNGDGTVTRDVTKDGYASGSTVTLTATPSAGWKFDHWEGDAQGTANLVQVPMDKSKNVKAVFVQDNYALTTSSEGQGSVTRDVTKDGYASGSTVTLTATPSAGWHFDHWEGDAQGTANPVQVPMDKSKNVKAVFVQDNYALATSSEGQGSVTRDAAKDGYASGSTVTLTATPSAGWHFDHWEGDAQGTANPVQVPMDKAKNVKAVFVQDEYTLATSTEGQGTVAKNADQNKYLSGSTVTLTATPTTGWYFDHWEGDAQGTAKSVQVSMDKSKTVKAVFVQCGTISGHVVNGTTGQVVSNATINVRSGQDNQSGAIAQTVTTDSNGNYTVNNLVPGEYTVETLASGYNNRYANVQCVSAQTASSNTSLMPIINNDNVRVNLTWGNSPSDLDSHLTTPEGDEVYYDNKTGDKSASLDNDVTSGNGPENITVYKDQQESGEYLYRVYNYSASHDSSATQIKDSNAVVNVYKGNTLVNTFNVSDAQGNTGLYWNVFNLNGDSITPINTISPSNKYALTTSVQGNGTITSNETSNQYSDGENATLTATPSAGWHFDHWEGDVTGTENPVQITMDSNKTVTAVFVQD